MWERRWALHKRHQGMEGEKAGGRVRTCEEAFFSGKQANEDPGEGKNGATGVILVLSIAYSEQK